ncbi:MAG: hypothetical protein MJK12_12390 [Colwellia sp.]|nr:hypothetical protein [Colwellia sp.]
MSRKLLLLTTVVLTAGVFYMRTRTPLNVRNKNPLNIRASKSYNWVGQTGEASGFAVFESIEHGFRAAYKTMLTYKRKYQFDTISEILNRWAPSEENPTRAYIDYVENALNVDEDTVLTPEDYPHLILAMSVFEGAKGRNGYTIEQVRSGVALA